MDNNVKGFVEQYRGMGLEGTPASPEEIEVREQQLGTRFPAAYKAFLLILGRDGGSDFVGSDCTVHHLPMLRRWAEDLLRQCGSRFTLPDNALVYLMHQGYSFFYFLADGSTEDPPVFMYRENDLVPTKKAESFTLWLTM